MKYNEDALTYVEMHIDNAPQVERNNIESASEGGAGEEEEELPPRKNKSHVT